MIEGETQTLSEENVRFRTGSARIDPLVLRESFYLLEELAGREHSKEDCPADEIEIEEMTEPIVIAGEDEEMP